MTEALAAEAPFWEPGTRQGYHATTFGHLVGEVVRRVSGRPFDEFFRTEVAGPLGLDFHIGLPEECEDRIAPTIRADPPRAARRGNPRPRCVHGNCSSCCVLQSRALAKQRHAYRHRNVPELFVECREWQSAALCELQIRRIVYRQVKMLGQP